VPPFLFQSRRVRPRILLLFITVALLYAAPGMLPGRVLAPMDIQRDYLAWKHDPAVRVRVSNSLLSDVPLQLVPWDTQSRRLLARGEMPWRNELAGDGEHLFANPLAALLSPFTWPRLLWGLHGWAISVFLKLLVAMLSMYWLGRAAGGSEFASIVSALVFALSGYAIVWALYPHTNVFVLLPAFAASAIERRYVVMALIAAAATLGGHPETLAIGVIAIFVFIRFERRAVFASLAGFLMGGVQLVPFAILFARSHIRFARLEQVAPLFRRFSIPALVLPGYLGSPLRGELDLTGAVHSLENFNQRCGAYIGALALLAIVMSFRQLAPIYRRGLIIGTVALLLSLGMSYWIAPEYYAAAFVLFAALAAGPAIEVTEPRRAFAVVGLLLVIGGLLPSVVPLEGIVRFVIAHLRALGHLQQSAAVYESRLPEYLAAAKWTALRRVAMPGLSLVVFALARRREWRAAAVILELASFGLGYNPSIGVREIAPNPLPIRTGVIAASTVVFPPNVATLYGIREIHAYDILTSEEYTRRLLPAGYDPLHWDLPPVPSADQQRALASLGVQYYVTPEGVIEIANPSPPQPVRNTPPDGILAGAIVSLAGVLLLFAVVRL